MPKKQMTFIKLNLITSTLACIIQLIVGKINNISSDLCPFTPHWFLQYEYKILLLLHGQTTAGVFSNEMTVIIG